MPRAKRSPAPMLVVPAPEREEIDPSAPNAEAGDALERMGDEGARKLQARVYRVDPNTNKEGMLDCVDPNLIDEPWIRENYGGGRYFVRFWGPLADGSFNYIKKKSREFTVDPSIPFKGALRERQQPLTGPVQTGQPNTTGDDDADMKMLFKSQLLNLIKEQNESRNTSTSMLMNMMSQQSAAQQQFMALVLQLFTANKSSGGLGEMKEFLGPLITGTMNRKDPTEIAATLIGLMKPNTEMRDMFGMIREMKETADIFGGAGERDGDDGGPILRMLEKSMPGLVEILKNESQKTGIPMRQLATAPGRPATTTASVRPVAPSPQLPPAEPASPTAQQPTVQDEWTPLEPYLPYLVNFAAENREPFGVVQTVKTLAPGTVMASIRELVARSDAVSVVLNRFPALQPFPAWTAALLDEFYSDAFGDDDDEDEEPETPVTPTADHPSTGEPAT